MKTDKKADLRSKAFLVAGMPAAAEGYLIPSCVQKDEDGQKSGLAEQGLFGRRDACGGRGIFNPSVRSKG